MDAPDLLTLPQVAERLQVSRWTVYQLICAGELPSIHLGRCHRVRVRDYEAYVAGLGGALRGGGFDGTVTGYPCPQCDQPFCPRCGDCECGRRDARLVQCRGCYLRVAAHDVVDGRCSDCR